MYNLNAHTHIEVEGGRRGGWGLARGEKGNMKTPNSHQKGKKLFIAFAHPFIFQTLSCDYKNRLEVISCHLHSCTEDNQHQVNISEDIHRHHHVISTLYLCRDTGSDLLSDRSSRQGELDHNVFRNYATGQMCKYLIMKPHDNISCLSDALLIY